jgi:hypothetical protein
MATPSQSYLLEDDVLRVDVDPACGGKIRSLVSKRTGREYFHQDPRTSFSGDGYSDHDVTGLDECFPTVSPCNYPREPWQEVALGDHGWLWSRPWNVTVTKGSLTAAVEVSKIPLRFERTCRLVAPGELQLDYAIENRTNERVEFLYANHLLLYADSTTRVGYPTEMQKAFVTVTSHLPEIADRTWVDWPPPRASTISEPLDASRGNLIKCFSPRLRSGEATVTHGEQSESLRIEFDTVHLPYLGVLLVQGFGPVERDLRGLFIALEATTGMGDDLDGCRATNSSTQLQPSAAYKFQIKLSLLERPA